MKKINYKINSHEGIHIGVAYSKYEKGNVDSYTIRDEEGYPYIPATSIKGKFRYFLKNYNELQDKELNEQVLKFTAGESDSNVLERLFFSEQDNEENIFFNTFKKILFKDATLLESSKKDTVEQLFEIKAENSIVEKDGTLESNPRVIERTVKGLEYEFSIYIQGYTSEEEEVIENIINKIFFYISEFGYIGGSGSRGYGKVEITLSEGAK